MEIWEMRKAVKQAYPSEKWERKVSRMSDQQVYAIYERMRKDGKI